MNILAPANYCMEGPAMTAAQPSAPRQWLVVTHTSEYSASETHGPFASVEEAAFSVPVCYTQTLLPFIDGKRQFSEDIEASRLFERLRKNRRRPDYYHIDRATQ